MPQEIWCTKCVRGCDYDSGVDGTEPLDAVEHSPGIGQVLDNVAGDDDIKLLINREIVQPYDISTDYVVEYRKPAQLFNNVTAAIDADHIRTLTELPMQALFGRPNP